VPPVPARQSPESGPIGPERRIAERRQVPNATTRALDDAGQPSPGEPNQAARRGDSQDLDDERYDAPEAFGLDVAVRGLSMVCDDHRILDITAPMFDGLYEYIRRRLVLGREPA
jgi:hypothetical protein